MVAVSETGPATAQNGGSPNSKEGSANNSPTKVVEQSPEEQKATAFASLASGKRHLLVSDIPLAVTTLGDACEQLSTVFGETASEMAEVYFYYGKALLEMARLESGVLGNALDGVPETEEDGDSSQVEDPEKLTEKEKEEVGNDVEDALEENFDKHDKIAKIHTGVDMDEDAEESEGGEEDEAANGDGEKNEAEAEKPKDGEKEDVDGGEREDEDKSEQDAEDEEDPSNLQLAWEMLELAKVVFAKTAETKKDAELERRICETYMVLGEVSLENENYPQAVEDLTICLNKRVEGLPADSRCIAETHYQLGIAQGFDMKWEEAVVSLEAAIKVLETRIANLKAKTESPDESKKDDSTHTREKEAEELETLIPEIKEKIVDTNEMKSEALRKMKEAVGFTFSSSGSSSSAGTSSSSGAQPIAAKPIASIAIKRKAEEKESEAKKVKGDGDAAAASTTA